MSWYKISDILPEDGEIVETKIDDERGCRNVQQLKFQHNRWFTKDGSMWVYYKPTHWKYSWM